MWKEAWPNLIYLPTYLPTYLPVYGSTVLLLHVGRFFSLLTLYTVDRIALMGDQPVARPLPIHRTTQAQNKHTQTSMPWVGFEPTISTFERTKTVHVLDRAATVIGQMWATNLIFSLEELREKMKLSRALPESGSRPSTKQGTTRSMLHTHAKLWSQRFDHKAGLPPTEPHWTVFAHGFCCFHDIRLLMNVLLQRVPGPPAFQQITGAQLNRVRSVFTHRAKQCCM
jgi:hypothetical protein